jgi:hypothetical protein
MIYDRCFAVTKQLAKVIRKADPSYDPAKAPDLRYSDPKPLDPSMPNEGSPWNCPVWATLISVIVPVMSN